VAKPFRSDLSVEITQQDKLGFVKTLLQEFTFFDDALLGFVSQSDALKIYISYNSQFKVRIKKCVNHQEFQKKIARSLQKKCLGNSFDPWRKSKLES
jgi:hypothetical protein